MNPFNNDIHFTEAQLRWLESLYPEQTHEVPPDKAVYHRGQRSVVQAVRDRTQRTPIMQEVPQHGLV